MSEKNYRGAPSVGWFEAFLFFLPAGVANLTPVIINKVPVIKLWKTPLDFGKSWRGKRIFGANKSWRGLISGTIVAAFVGLALQAHSSVEASAHLGAAMGAGALLGDALESFFKRQRGIESGQKWFPFDQTDYIIGGLLFAWPFTSLTLSFVGYILVLYFGLHLLVAYLAYKLGLKDAPI